MKKTKQIKSALMDATHWEDFITDDESKLPIAYHELKEKVIERIMRLYNFKK